VKILEYEFYSIFKVLSRIFF